MDKMTKGQRSKLMSSIKYKGSKIEKILEADLSSMGFDFERSPKDVLGKPDITFKPEKIAVFCDSEFWHGFDWEVKKLEIKSNKEFWISKIEKNMKRDQTVNTELTKQGWKVIRFWGKEIIKEHDNCVKNIANEVVSRRAKA